ncbi:MAG: hypothetical protein ACRELY_09790 [Polyangiaceae bacterium]
MRLIDLAPFLPIAAFIFAPLACSSSSGDDGVAADNDGGDQGDDGGDTTGDGGTKKDASGPFTPGPHPGFPQVPNNGGGAISNPRVVTIVPQNESTTGLSGFAAAFMASNTWKSVDTEYGLGAAGTPINLAPATTMTGDQTNTAIEQYIQTTVNATSGADPDGHTIYLVFLPAAAYIDGDQGCQTQGIGGYHTVFDGNVGSTFQSSAVWGVVQHCTGTAGEGLTDAQWATIAASHEIVEAATDYDGYSGYAFPQASGSPPSFNIWDDVFLTELGDLCVQTQITEGAYTYQRMWSNKAAANAMDPCAPSITPYFNTGAIGGDSNGWFSTSGGSVTIPLEAFSNVAVDDWVVEAVLGESTQSGWSGNVVTPGGTPAQRKINNNQKGTFTVTAPAGAGSGSYAIFELASISTTATTGEFAHIWPIGVKVP